MRRVITYFFMMLSTMSFGLCSPDGMKIMFTSNSNFVYDHQTAIVYNNEPGFKLPSAVERIAKIINRDLGQSMFFNTEFLSDIKKVRRHHVKNKPNKANVGSLYWVTTVDNIKLGCTYFNRGSDTLLVVGGGFTNARELMSPFIDMFTEPDVLLIDFRGHGLNPEVMTLNPIKRAFGIDPALVTFGVHEHRDVFAMVNAFRLQKKEQQKQQNMPVVGYKNVYGLGVCYSAFVFTKAAAIAESMNSEELLPEAAEFKDCTEIAEHGLFDKLILDGCWLSLPLFVEKIRDDIATLDNPQTGGLADHWFFNTNSVKSGIDFVATYLVGLQHHSSICLLDYVPSLIKTPLLFFACQDDYMIRRHEFETLYNAIPSPEKTVVLTSKNYHIRNHLKQKELYKLVSDLFFQLPQESFIECLRSPEKIVAYSKERLDIACQAAIEAEKEQRDAEELVRLLVEAD